MIRRALNSVPARPAVIAAPILAVVVLAVHYYSVYKECSALSNFRQHFTNSVGEFAKRDSMLALSEITDFPWEYVRAFESFEPQREKRNCPFGWDWPNDYRREISGQGLLSVILFFNNDALVRVLDFRNDEISVDGIDEKLTPSTARFQIETTDARPEYRLRLVN